MINFPPWITQLTPIHSQLVWMATDTETDMRGWSYRVFSDGGRGEMPPPPNVRISGFAPPHLYPQLYLRSWHTDMQYTLVEFLDCGVRSIKETLIQVWHNYDRKRCYQAGSNICFLVNQGVHIQGYPFLSGSGLAEGPVIFFKINF